MSLPSLNIVKIGGNIANDDAQLDSFLSAFNEISMPKILIHGGGKKATLLGEKLGIQTTMIDGRRITDADSLEIAIMVYGGLINKKIVAMLQSIGINALGLTGADLNVICARKRPVLTVDFGFVGDIETVNSDLLVRLLSDKVTPVLAPITHDGMGQLLNTNADTMASKVASSLTDHYHVALSFCFDHEGVMVDLDGSNNETFPLIRKSKFLHLKDTGGIHSGMLPKLQNAMEASRSGVDEVYICGISNLACHTNATKIEWDED